MTLTFAEKPSLFLAVSAACYSLYCLEDDKLSRLLLSDEVSSFRSELREEESEEEFEEDGKRAEDSCLLAAFVGDKSYSFFGCC